MTRCIVYGPRVGVKIAKHSEESRQKRSEMVKAWWASRKAAS